MVTIKVKVQDIRKMFNITGKTGFVRCAESGITSEKRPIHWVLFRKLDNVTIGGIKNGHRWEQNYKKVIPLDD